MYKTLGKSSLKKVWCMLIFIFPPGLLYTHLIESILCTAYYIPLQQSGIVAGNTVRAQILPAPLPSLGSQMTSILKPQVNSLNKPNLESFTKILSDNSETVAYKHSCVPDSKSISSVKDFV